MRQTNYYCTLTPTENERLIANMDDEGNIENILVLINNMHTIFGVY